MQKIIQCFTNINSQEILLTTANEYLENGWKVVSITAQICSIAGKGQANNIQNVFGGFLVVIEKDDSVSL